MGKTHLSGLSIGDTGVGIFGATVLSQRVMLPALATNVKMHFPENVLLLDAAALDSTFTSVAVTFELVKDSISLDVVTTVAGELTPVVKYIPAGHLIAKLNTYAGTSFPISVFITYTTSP
jgi:hypothetical protein